jgi:hypothetical protein
MDDDLYMVEYNWKRKYFHYEPVGMRIKKNISQVIYEGKPRNPDWIVVGICEWDKTDELIKEFIKAREKIAKSKMK